MLKKIEKSIFLSKPIIGVVARRNEDSYKIKDSIFKMIIRFDAIPLLILPINYDSLNSILDICDGIIMPGGEDIHEYDIYICKYAIKKDIPLLGICLGMQIMASIDNDNLIINKNNHNGITHKIKTNDNTLIKEIIGDSYVNSRHNYHIKDPGIYSISALSEDGYIEAIEYNKNKFNIGVQWHPEDMIDYDEKQLDLIKKFMDIASKKTD